jgi:hypothetical protein
MRKYIIPILLVLSIFSCKTVQLTDGTYITKRQERKIFEKSFTDSFGQMTEEELQLFEDVNFTVEFIVLDSIPVDTTPKNRFLVLDLRNNMSYEQTLPIGSDFWEYNNPSFVQILDTLEYHYKK